MRKIYRFTHRLVKPANVDAEPGLHESYKHKKLKGTKPGRFGNPCKCSDAATPTDRRLQGKRGTSQPCFFHL